MTNVPDRQLLARAANRAKVEADRADDQLTADIHRACSGLLEEWVECIPHLRLGGLYPGLHGVSKIAATYVTESDEGGA